MFVFLFDCLFVFALSATMYNSTSYLTVILADFENAFHRSVKIHEQTSVLKCKNISFL